MTTSPQPADSEAEPPVRRGRGRPRDPETDQRITAAAARLMLQHGFEGTTVDEVAALARVGKATVYRRWPSKEDLAVAAMGTLYDNEFPEADTGSIEGDLLESYRGVLEFVNSGPGTSFMRTSIIEAVRDPRIAALYRSSAERQEERARRALERAVERGEVRGDADMSVAVQWLGGLLSYLMVTGRPLPTVDDAEALVRFTLSGIRTRP